MPSWHNCNNHQSGPEINEISQRIRQRTDQGAGVGRSVPLVFLYTLGGFEKFTASMGFGLVRVTSDAYLISMSSTYFLLILITSLTLVSAPMVCANNTWNYQSTVVGPVPGDGRFATTLSLSGDGAYLATNHYSGDNETRLYEYDGNNFILKDTISTYVSGGGYGLYGKALSISDTNLVYTGSTANSSNRVDSFDASGFSSFSTYTSSSDFGGGSAMNAQGTVIVENGREPYDIKIRKLNGVNAVLKQTITRNGPNTANGSVAISDDGATIVSGVTFYSPNNGQVDTFTTTDFNTWTKDSVVLSGNNRFGFKVALSNDGLLLAISSTFHNNRDGKVDIYKRESDAWVLRNTVYGNEADSEFGFALDFDADGNVLAIASRGGNSRIYSINADDTVELQGTLKYAIDIDLNDDGDFLTLINKSGGSGDGIEVYSYGIAVPEPSTYALLIGSVVLTSAFLKRRFKS